MKKNSKKSKAKYNVKRVRSLVILLAFTAVLLIAEIYAWFTNQRNVSINNLQGKVKAAEGLLISLDAENWSASIDLGTKDDNGVVTPNWENYDAGIGSVAINDVNGNTITAKTTNIRPKVANATETGYMNPVSSTGVLRGENKTIGLFSGTLQGTSLEEINQVNEDEDDEANLEALSQEGYYAFDLYIMNTTSEEGITKEQLQLNADSFVEEIRNASEDYGLKNSVRVAFALFDGTADVNATKTQVLEATYDSEISQVAIWEPNADSHSEYVIGQDANMQNRIDELGGKTYALNEIPVNSVINNVYSTTEEGTAEQGTVKTSEEGITVVNLTNTEGNAFEIEANKISKIRVYVWLEGQDVDNVNWATHSEGINLGIGLTKGQEEIETDEVPEELKRYILGENLQGREIWADGEIGIFEWDDEPLYVNSTGILEEDAIHSGLVYEEIFYVKYKGIIYKFATDDECENTDPSYGVKKVGEPLELKAQTAEIEIGSTVKYDGKDYIVMYKDGNKIQMISKDALKYDENNEGSFYLGYQDSYLSKYDDTFKAMPTTSLRESLAKAKYSHDRSIATLNLACGEIVNQTPNYVTGVRSVGSDPQNPNKDTSGTYSSEFLATHPVGDGWTSGEYNGVGKDTDFNFEKDYDRLVQLGITVANKEGTTEPDYYWLASRFVGEGPGNVDFYERDVDGDGVCDCDRLWYVAGSYAHGYGNDRLLRPVVSITLDSALGCTWSWDEASEKWVIGVKIPEGLAIGDEVEYSPSGTYNFEAQYSGYDSDESMSSASGQNFRVTNWKVLNIDEGTGKIELVASAPTSGEVCLQGENGYNNAVKLLNDACSNLYGDESKGITARSINIEDIEGKMDMSSSVVTSAKTSAGYGAEKGPYTTENSWYPAIYADEENSKIGDGVRRTDGLGLSKQESFVTGKTQGDSITPIHTYYYLDASNFTTALGANSSIIPNDSGKAYWVASRCVGARDDYCYFYVRSVFDGRLYRYSMFNSNVSTSLSSKPVLPVVSLSSKLLSGGTSTEWKVE